MAKMQQVIPKREIKGAGQKPSTILVSCCVRFGEAAMSPLGYFLPVATVRFQAAQFELNVFLLQHRPLDLHAAISVA